VLKQRLNDKQLLLSGIHHPQHSDKEPTTLSPFILYVGSPVTSPRENYL